MQKQKINNLPTATSFLTTLAITGLGSLIGVLVTKLGLHAGVVAPYDAHMCYIVFGMLFGASAATFF